MLIDRSARPSRTVTAITLTGLTAAFTLVWNQTATLGETQGGLGGRFVDMDARMDRL